MDLETVKKLIKKYIPGHENFISRVQTAERYYLNDNDILHIKHSEDEKPLRNADNRIPSNFHGLLVDQSPHICLRHRRYLMSGINRRMRK